MALGKKISYIYGNEVPYSLDGQSLNEARNTGNQAIDHDCFIVGKKRM